MNKRVVLVGGFHEIIELCDLCSIKIVGIIVNNLQDEYYGLPILGTDMDANKLYRSLKEIPLVITPDNPIVRWKLVSYYKKIGFKFTSLISSQANISRSANIGVGSVVQAGVNISSYTRIGDFCKLNTNANVMHDNVIGDYVSIAPNAVSLGYVTIKTFSYIGANSTILPKKVVNENCIVGAGAVVTKDVEQGTTVIGIPAKVLKKD